MKSLTKYISEGILDDDFSVQATSQIESKIKLLQQEFENSNKIADEIMKWYEEEYGEKFELEYTDERNLGFANVTESMYFILVPGKFKFRAEDTKFLANCFNKIHSRFKDKAKQWSVTGNPRNGTNTGYFSKSLDRSFETHEAAIVRDSKTKQDYLRVYIFKYDI